MHLYMCCSCCQVFFHWRSVWCTKIFSFHVRKNINSALTSSYSLSLSPLSVSPSCPLPLSLSDCQRSWSSFFNSIPFVCFAFQCHVSSVPVYSGLKNRSVWRFFFVILAAVFLCTTLYSLTGAFGLITFSQKGACINSDIMRNYCPTDIPVSVARGMLFLCLVTSYPILAFCGR